MAKRTPKWQSAVNKIRRVTTSQLVNAARAGEHGKNWYQDANRSAREFLAESGDDNQATLDLFSAVVGVTSPRISVERNAMYATAIWVDPATKPSGCLRQSYNRACQLLNGSKDYRQFLARGIKSANFAANIAGDLSRCTNDTHMAKLFGISGEDLADVRVYAAMTRKVEAAAKKLGWSVAETQAALWTTSTEGNPTLRRTDAGELSFSESFKKYQDRLSDSAPETV